MEIYKERDFNTVFADAMAFMRTHLKTIALSFLIICGPLVFIYSLSVTFITQQSFSTVGLWFSPVNFGLWSIIGLIAGLAAFLFNLGIIAEMYLLYMKNPEKPITYQAVWAALKADIGRLFSTFLSFMLLGMVVGLIIGLAFVLFAFILGGVPVVGAILMFLFAIALLLIFPQLMFFSTAIYVTRLQDKNISFSEAMSLVYDLIKENFWTTWVVVFVASLIVSIIYGVGSFINGIIIAVMFFNSGVYNGGESLLVSVVRFIFEFLYHAFYLVFYAITILWFFSLYEKKFSVGIQQELDSIGQDDLTNDNDDNPLII
jgi:hypothetical protein